MRRSIRSQDGRRNLCALSLKEDVSQTCSKLNYGQRSWQKFAGQESSTLKKERKLGNFLCFLRL